MTKVEIRDATQFCELVRLLRAMAERAGLVVRPFETPAEGVVGYSVVADSKDEPLPEVGVSFRVDRELDVEVVSMEHAGHLPPGEVLVMGENGRRSGLEKLMECLRGAEWVRADDARRLLVGFARPDGDRIAVRQFRLMELKMGLASEGVGAEVNRLRGEKDGDGFRKMLSAMAGEEL